MRVPSADAAKTRALTLRLHEADLADLIQLLRPEQRGVLIGMLGDDFKAAALPELDEAVRDQVLEVMPTDQVAEAIQELDSDDAVYVIEDLDKQEQSDILAKLPSFERAQLERSLEYPEDSAGRIMQTDLIAALPRHLAAMHCARAGLVALELPIPVVLNQIRVVVPKAALTDAGIAWLFDTICHAIDVEMRPPLTLK